MAVDKNSELQRYLASVPEWNDDGRAAALYSTFPAKSVNKTAYEARLSTWKRILSNAAISGYLSSNQNDGRLCVYRRHLEVKFKRRGVMPLGLQAVIDEMVATGELVEFEHFTRDDQRSWRGWLYEHIIQAPISWAWVQVSGSKNGASDEEKVYVFVQAVKDASAALSKAVYDTSHSSIDLIYSMQDLQKQFGKDLSLSDVMLVCHQLARDQKVVLDRRSSLENCIVKFKPTRGELAPVSETDTGILTIKTTLHHLNKQVSQLDERSAELLEQTKQFIRNKERIRAKFVLRQRKTVSDILAKRLQSLETLESILQQLQSAETDAELLSVYEIGSKTLKDFVAEKGLTVERVDATMDALDDALADQREVEDAMTSGNNIIASASGAATISDEELEAELDALTAQPVAAPRNSAEVVINEEKKQSHIENEAELIRELVALSVPATSNSTSNSSRAEKEEEIPAALPA